MSLSYRNRFVTRSKRNYSASTSAIDSKLDKILLAVSNVDKKVTSLEGKVTSLEGKVTSLEGKVTSLDNRITAIEGDMSILKNDMAFMKMDISGLKTGMTRLKSEVNGYYKRASNIQEITATYQIYNRLLDIYPTYNFKVLDTFRIFYNPRGEKILTDLDGAIIMTNRPMKANADYSNDYYADARSLIKNTNTFTYDTTFDICDLIVVEAKHGLNMHNILYKIKQVYNMYTCIRSTTPKSLKQASVEYLNMYYKYIHPNNIKHIGIVITSDAISPEIARYLDDINDGMTYGKQMEYLFSFFKSDPMYTQLVNDTTIDIALRQQIRDARSIIEIYGIDIKKYESYIKKYAIMYTEYDDAFEYVKGRIGYYDNSKFKYDYSPDFIFHTYN